MHILVPIVLFFLLSAAGLHAEDEAVRAFLGITASRADLAPPSKPVFYLATIAKFENGVFTGFGFLGTGMNRPGFGARNFIEVAWGVREGKAGYVFIDPISTSSFTPDPIFQHLISSHVKTRSLSPKPPTFHGFDIISCASSQRKGSEDPLLASSASNFEEDIQAYDHAIAILYREFADKENYMKVLAEFEAENKAQKIPFSAEGPP